MTLFYMIFDFNV